MKRLSPSYTLAKPVLPLDHLGTWDGLRSAGHRIRVSPSATSSDSIVASAPRKNCSGRRHVSVRPERRYNGVACRVSEPVLKQCAGIARPDTAITEGTSRFFSLADREAPSWLRRLGRAEVLDLQAVRMVSSGVLRDRQFRSKDRKGGSIYIYISYSPGPSV